MKFLVTGANGFVGSALVAALHQRSQFVRCAVRALTDQCDETESAVVGNIDGQTDWRDVLCGIDVVIHLAARVHVMRETAVDPLAEFLEVNLHGTVNLARQAVRAGVKRLVYVSSIKVNGESTEAQPFSESDNPNPQGPYAVSKWQAEQALQRIAQETGLEVVIVRPPLIYGSGVKGNFIKLLAAIDKGIPLPLAGARNPRSLLYVGNLADALITCATHPAAVGKTYLVCDGEDVSAASLTEKIAQALNRKSRSFYLPPCLLRFAASVMGRSNQIDRLLGSLRVNDKKIRSELAWVPPYTMEHGLKAVTDWHLGIHQVSGRDI